MTKMIKPVKKPAKTKIQNARISFVLDRSGSMASIRDETIGGYNAFIDTQKKMGGKTKVTLVQFDNEYLVTYADTPIENVPLLDRTTFVPRGMTALYDAVGRTINNLQAVPAAKNEKTIIAILTDGQENGSHEFDHPAIKAQITRVQDELGWEVIFVGANMNAQEVGRSYGIPVSNVATFAATGKGALDAMNTMSATSSIMRGAKLKGFAGAMTMDKGNLNAQTVYQAYASNAKIEEDKDDAPVPPTA